MAQGDQRFSHISVSAGDEDDVVIVAGAASSRPACGDASPAPAPEQGREPEHVPEHARKGDDEPRKAASSAPEAPAKAPATASREGARDRYEETTLEDLQGTKMSAMQKGIIVVAVIGVIAFAVYYVFLR